MDGSIESTACCNRRRLAILLGPVVGNSTYRAFRPSLIAPIRMSISSCFCIERTQIIPTLLYESVRGQHHPENINCKGVLALHVLEGTNVSHALDKV